jgi:Uma2 family endonuclease
MTLPTTLEQSPRLALILAEIQAKLAAEQEARRRFFEETPEGSKAEFINGETIMTPPAALQHTDCEANLLELLRTHVRRHQLGFVGHEKMLVCLTRNDYEPDVAFWDKEKSQDFTPKQHRFPAPNFVAEILSDSTENRDRGVKMDDYAAHGVAEYWLVDPEAQRVEQYLLQGDAYQLALKSTSGDIESAAVPGFRIPIAALFDDKANLAALKAMLV